MPEKKDQIPSQEGTERLQKIVQQNFSRWNESFKSGSPQAVAALYAESATFLPTVSGEFKKGQAGAEEYFRHFLKKNPIGRIVEDEVQVISPDCYLHSGMYNFEVGLKDKREIVEARFSFLWKRDEQGQWKIMHHHSSVKPEES